MDRMTRPMFAVALAASLAAGATIAAAPAMQVKRLPTLRPIAPAAGMAPDRAQLVQDLEAGRVQLRDITPGPPVRLDLRNAVAEGVASISFDYASHVSPADNAVTFERLAGDLPSRAKLTYRAPAAGVYVVDVSVTGHAPHGGEGERTLSLESLGSPVQTQALKTGAHHVYYFVEATAPGPMFMVVQSKSTGWTFHAIEVARFK